MVDFTLNMRVLVTRPPAQHVASPGWQSHFPHFFTGVVMDKKAGSGRWTLVQIDPEHRKGFLDRTIWYCDPAWLEAEEGPW